MNYKILVILKNLTPYELDVKYYRGYLASKCIYTICIQLITHSGGLMSQHKASRQSSPECGAFHACVPLYVIVSLVLVNTLIIFSARRPRYDKVLIHGAHHFEIFIRDSIGNVAISLWHTCRRKKKNSPKIDYEWIH